jgi:hypothetical protein
LAQIARALPRGENLWRQWRLRCQGTEWGMLRQLRIGLVLGTLGLGAGPVLAVSPPVPLQPADETVAPLLVQAEEAEDGGEEGEDISAFPDNFQFPRIPLTFPPSAEAAGLSDFLATLRGIVEKRDEPALLAAVASKIFWDSDFGGGYDDSRSGVDNFRDAMQIGVPDILPEYADDGWKRLAGSLASGRFATEPDHPGVYCTPAFPTLTDAKAAEPTFEKVDMGEDGWQLQWAYVDGKAEARDKAAADATAIATLENEAVPVYAWSVDDNFDWVDVGLPDGRRAYLDVKQVGSWISERVCLGKSGDKWAIVGYIGGGD